MVFPMNDDESKKELRFVYGRVFASSLSNNMISPFVYDYATRMGASPSEIGLMSSFNNLFANSLQVPWGRLSDILRRRISIIVVTSVVSSLILISMALITEPKTFIILTALYFFFSSASIPAQNALLMEMTKPSSRSMIISNMNTASLLGGLVATLFSGLLIDYEGGRITLSSAIAAALSLAGSLILLKIKEDGVRKVDLKGIASIFRVSDTPSLINENSRFKLFLRFSAIHGFFMSFAWPLFTITRMTILNLSMTEVGAISVIQNVVTLMAQPLMGRLVLTKDRKSLMGSYYVSLTVVPLVYCFAQSFIHIAILSIFLGFILAIGNATILPYILDIIPEDHAGELISIYNMIAGISYFMGSIIGGNMVGIMSQYLGRQPSLQIGYTISATGRFVLGILFLKAIEVKPDRKVEKVIRP